MDIAIFSRGKAIKTIFTTLEKSKKYTVSFYSADDLKKVVKKLKANSMIYFDITNMNKNNINMTVKFLSTLENMIFGIIDPKNAVADISELFFNGTSDYIGKNIVKDNITEKRIDKIKAFKADFFKKLTQDKKNAKSEIQYILSGKDWKNIRSGNEYTFCLMFIELDNQAKLKNKFDGEHFNKITEIFQNYLTNELEQLNGKIWMWMDFGGLILFPFDGKNCAAILSSYRLMLDSNIISAEEFGYDIKLSYRIALHIGNTIYQRRGDTGEIISDSINSIFHLGQKFAKAGNFYLTEDLRPYIPSGLEESFIDAGRYEGREIIKMKKIIR